MVHQKLLDFLLKGYDKKTFIVSYNEEFLFVLPL